MKILLRRLVLPETDEGGEVAEVEGEVDVDVEEGGRTVSVSSERSSERGAPLLNA